ncbi:MAG: hypothetical protein JNK04_10680, partial [Myxococcales bacterium]|nr:hypothetical protein [Myxococcales bacterium]
MVTKESIQQTLGLLCICFAAACGSSSGDSVPLGGEAVGGAEEGGSGNQGGHGGEAEPPPPVDGDPCGECGAGEWRDAACHMPSMDVDLVRGLPPAPTDHRDVFNPDDFEGSDTLKLERASQAAAAVGGAVVMHRVFETIETVYAYEGVMYTGGGIRRACTPVATVVRPSLPSDSCVRVDTTEGFSRGTLLAGVVGPAANDYKGLMALATGSADELCAYSALGFSLPAGAKIVQTS